MGQSLLANDLDNLVVQVAAELNLHSISRAQPQRLCKFSGVACDHGFNFSHRSSPSVSAAQKQSHALVFSESSSRRHERSELNRPIVCNKKLDTSRNDL